MTFDLQAFHETRSRPPHTPWPRGWVSHLSLPVILALAAQGLAGPVRRAAAQFRDPGQLAALEARSLGPAGMSGRITSIDAVGSDPNVIFVGTATGGLWRSGNGGQTWTPVFDDQPVLGIGAVAIFQADPAIVWVGTGEGNPRSSAGVGRGIYKSFDGGDTWTFLGLENSERIHRIVLHPSNPDVAWVGVMGPAWSDGEERGVYRTVDGGQTWERVLWVDGRTGVADLVQDPSDPEHLLAAMWEFRREPWFFESGGPGSGLYLTRDGGDAWTRLTAADGLPGGDLGRIGLAFAPGDPRIVYALVEASRTALLRSDDGGRGWRIVNHGSEIATRPFYFADIFVDPADPLRVYDLASRLNLSEDGGRTFRAIAQGVHSDFQALWIHAGDSRLMYVGTDGGVYVTRDRGENWRMIENLPTGQFYHVAVDMEVPFNIYGGTQDNGSWRGPSDLWEGGGIRNPHWREVEFEDGFGTIPDPSDPTLGYSMSQGGGLVRFDLRTGERKSIRPWAPDTVSLRFNWNAPLATDPFDPATLYFGSQFLHKSTTRGESWQIISPDLTTDDPDKQRQTESGGLTRDVTGAENHTTIVSIAPSPVTRELIWVGTDDGRVHLTQSGGGYWQEVGRRIRGVPDGAWVSHIEPSKHEGGTAYVAFDDHRRGDWKPYLLRTENYGEDWRRVVEADQIRGFVHVLEEDPTTPNLLFAGTEFGLWVSLDRGESWFQWTSGLPSVPVRALTVHPRDQDLVIGTHGRGIYVLDDVRPLQALARIPSLTQEPVYLFDPPPAYLRGTAGGDGDDVPGDESAQGRTRRKGALITYWVGALEAASGAEIRILDRSGAVVRTLSGSANPGVNRVSWNLLEDVLETEDWREGERVADLPVPEVLPGRYTVRVGVDGAESEASLDVLPDPRTEIPMDERERKQDAVREAMGLMATERVLEVRRAQLETALDGAVEDLRKPAFGQVDSLRNDIDAIRGGLAEVEGILARVAQDNRALRTMARTRGAPTEAERIALERTEERIEEAIVRLNGLMVTRVRELGAALEAAGLPGFPSFRVVIPEGRWRRGGGENPPSGTERDRPREGMENDDSF